MRGGSRRGRLVADDEADGDRHESDLILGDRDDAIPDAGRKDGGYEAGEQATDDVARARGLVAGGIGHADGRSTDHGPRVERRSERRDPDTPSAAARVDGGPDTPPIGRGSNAATISRAPPQL